MELTLLSKEIQETIRKNLPAAATGVLLEIIQEAEANLKKIEFLEDRVEELSKDLSTKSLTIANLEGRVKDENTLNELSKALKAKELVLELRERSLNETILKDQLASMTARNNDNYAFIMMLAKNPRAIEIINGSYSGQVPIRDNNGYITQYNDSGGHHETKEKKETKED